MQDVPDLGKIREEQQTAERLERQAEDLSAEAIKERVRDANFQAAARWAIGMHRAFKGIRGAPNRRQRAEIALKKFGLEDV